MENQAERPDMALERLTKTEPGSGDLLLIHAQGVVVTSQEEADEAGGIIRECAARVKAIKAAIEPHKKAAHGVWRGLCDEENRQCGPYEAAAKSVKRTVDAWSAEQLRIAREAAAAEARRVAEEARIERQRQIEIERAAGATKREAEAAAREVERAQVLQAQAAVQSVAAPKVAGMRTVRRWVGDVLDIREMCADIAAGNLPTTLIEVRTAEMNKLAATWRDAKTFRGVRFREVAGVSR